MTSYVVSPWPSIIILLTILIAVVLKGRREQNNRTGYSNAEQNRMFYIVVLCSIAILALYLVWEVFFAPADDFVVITPIDVLAVFGTIAPYAVFALTLAYGKKIEIIECEA